MDQDGEQGSRSEPRSARGGRGLAAKLRIQDRGRGRQEDQAIGSRQVDARRGRSHPENPPLVRRRNKETPVHPHEQQEIEHRRFQPRTAPGQKGPIGRHPHQEQAQKDQAVRPQDRAPAQLQGHGRRDDQREQRKPQGQVVRRDRRGDAKEPPDHLQQDEPQKIRIPLDRPEGRRIPHESMPQDAVAHVPKRNIRIVGEEPE